MSIEMLASRPRRIGGSGAPDDVLGVQFLFQDEREIRTEACGTFEMTTGTLTLFHIHFPLDLPPDATEEDEEHAIYEHPGTVGYDRDELSLACSEEMHRVGLVQIAAMMKGASGTDAQALKLIVAGMERLLQSLDDDDDKRLPPTNLKPPKGDKTWIN